MNIKKIISLNSVNKKILILTLLLTLTLVPALTLGNEIPYTIKRITSGEAIDYYPEFSPDGKEIVFISKTDNTEKIKKGEFWHKSPYSLNLWLMDSDGEERRQLTSGDVLDFAPRFTPDAKRVVFVSNRREGKWDIWSIDTDGSNLKRIVETEKGTVLWEKVNYPFPTPDGKGLIFIIYNREPMCVWFMDMESRDIRRITSGGNGDELAMISPDGKEIVFKTTRPGKGDIWSIDMSGKNYRRLTFKDYHEFYPVWSPDGRKISYISEEKEGIFDIWVMDRDGKNKKKLTKYLLQWTWGLRFDYNDRIDIGYYHISWHPDGTKLALTTWDTDKKESYLTMLDFGKDIGKIIDNLPEESESLSEYTLIGEKELTNSGNWDDFGPSFNPDGNTMVFASNRKGNWDIWSIGSSEFGVQSDKDELIQLTNDTGDEIAPAFNPDGSKIAFLKEAREDENMRSYEDKKKLLTTQPLNLSTSYNVWIMKSDGSGAVQVTKGIKVISYPAWSPDGKEIAFVANGDKGPEIQLIPLNNPLTPFIKGELGDEGVVPQTYSVSRVISIWDTEKSNPAMFPFAKDENSEDYTRRITAWKRNESSPNLKARTVRSIFASGETIDPPSPPYPLKEFLYRIDYNTSGDRLIFESNRTGNIDIWSVKRNGTELTRITKGDGPHLNPVFSPDNKKIAYARRRLESISSNEANYNIWIADVKTGEEMVVNGEEQTDWNPVFSPNGKKIAYVTNRSGEFKHYNIWLLYLNRKP